MPQIRRPAILLIQAVDYEQQTLVGFQPLCTPLSIATIAALTPETFDVDLWDENLDGHIDEHTVLQRPHYDIVGISTLFEQVGQRVPALAELFRRRASYTCAGGPGISNQLKTISASVDSVFLNEAEYTWPQFLADWQRGTAQREYVQIAKPNLADSPPPRWDSIAARITDYRAAGVQTTRGCPFDCEFCDVIYLYGRAQRHKPVDRVLSEVATLQKLGARRIFFTDDEFIGDPRYTRSLLDALIPLNNSFPFPLGYHTQLTLNLSRHDDLLERVADANFWHALIGIESFNEESLRESNKVQNCRRDIVADCRKILSYGIGINGSLIVGFDHDGPDVFESILQGVRRACIPFASVSILRAAYGTKLWARLRESKRLWSLKISDSLPQALRMDILPGGKLTRAELIEGRIYVNKELSRVDNLCERLHGWLSLLRREPHVVNPQRLQLDAAINVVRTHRALSLTSAEVEAIAGVLQRTHQEAPIMMDRMLDCILAQLYWYRIRTYHTQEDLRTALAAEHAHELIQDAAPILLPMAFTAAFRSRLFSLVYNRLYHNLPDPQMIPEAASEIFVDFVIRASQETDTLAQQSFDDRRYDHFLKLLCDRTAARLTGQAPETFVGVDEYTATPAPGTKKTGLPDAVLKEVGDRLRRMNA